MVAATHLGGDSRSDRRASKSGSVLRGMLIAKEGIREIVLATLLFGAMGAAAGLVHWTLAIPFAALWLWVLYFFRDPHRCRQFADGELSAPADGTVTEITELDFYEPLGGPAVRIGIFLSLFDVHINRASCSGTVRRLSYRAGEYLDARHPDSGRLNESNSILMDPDEPMPGPIEIRQVAGFVARRIICHARASQALTIGERFGLIKFGSRTELIIPLRPDTEIAVTPGDKVRAGITVIARQVVANADSSDDRREEESSLAPVGQSG